MFKVDAYRFHIPHDLVGGFLESDIQAPLTPAAGCVRERSSQRGLTTPCCSTEQDTGSPIVALTFQHLIQVRNPGRHALTRHFMLQLKRRERKDRHSALVD